MEKELKKLTWKYFWQQKREEIIEIYGGWDTIFFLIILAIPIIFLLLIYKILFYIVIIIDITCISIIIPIWFNNNWKMAKINSKKELKVKKKI